MRITFLGTGSAMPTGERAQTGILLEGGDRPLLIDCGSGVLNNLARTDVGYEGVSTVLLTHHHLDHVSDLLALLKARWLAGEDHLEVVGPRGTEDLVEGLLGVHDYLQGRVDPSIREVEPTDGGDVDREAFEVAGYEVRALETRHSMYCLAYRLSIPGEREPDRDPPAFAFSGDTEAFEELVEFADGSAVLAHDCSFPDGVDVDNHPTPSELGRVLAGADAELGRVYLTHCYPHTEGRHDGMLASIAEHYDGDVRFAADVRSLTVE
ncbi:MBL fold metallo-hydrolase [Halobacteriales archaeon QS_8_69_26]|nr:MAG: MBL fold metallo-hydrolase [Halobacteriales archaeon QS_8_69_26]